MGILTLAYQRVARITLGCLSTTSTLVVLSRRWVYALATEKPKPNTGTADAVLHHGKIEAAVTLVLRAVQKDVEGSARDTVLQLYQVALELLSEALVVPLQCFPMKSLKATNGLANENKTAVNVIKETKHMTQPTAQPSLDENWDGLPSAIPVIRYVNTVVGVLSSWIHISLGLFRQFVDAYRTTPTHNRLEETLTAPLPISSPTIDPWGLHQGVISAAQQTAIWLKRSPLPSLVLFWFYFGCYIIRILDQYCHIWQRLRAWGTWCLTGLVAWVQHYRIHHHIVHSGVTLVTALAKSIVAYRATDSYYTIPIPTWFTQ
ncbi:hypothetical protein IWQ62_000285 [Dispira parvispora]|uniref:Uncharacterized protein n=1 Tax=Dispira parvispora TaxID=1520584 RepID=A0A9W8AW83_9FUNG|nr:hypothetical protein IWQ62_000285 [Dispira parvispora]